MGREFRGDRKPGVGKKFSDRPDRGGASMGKDTPIKQSASAERSHLSSLWERKLVPFGISLDEVAC